MSSYKLYGAILGDLAGQPYEFPAMKYFPNESDINLHNPESRITDDTLMTLALAKAILLGTSYEYELKDMGKKYRGDHYGKGFREWIDLPTGTVGNSFGNGCIMRISPFMYLERNDTNDILAEIISSCVTSHNHPVSIKACLDLYDLYQIASDDLLVWSNRLIDKFDEFKVRADDTYKFIESLYGHPGYNSTHEAIRKAISCGGDTDTNASIIGELMNFMHNDLTTEDVEYVESKLDSYLLNILRRFNE